MFVDAVVQETRKATLVVPVMRKRARKRREWRRGESENVRRLSVCWSFGASWRGVREREGKENGYDSRCGIVAIASRYLADGIDGECVAVAAKSGDKKSTPPNLFLLGPRTPL